MAKTQDSPAPDDTVTSHLPAESPAPSVEIPAMPKATTFFGRILSSGHGHIIRLIIFLTAAGILAGKYEDLSHTGRIISGVIVFIAALEMLYSRRERKRKCLLIPASATQTSFPLGPLTAAFHESFHLPDKAHVTVREWISAAPHPILHLSGLSGVGKSSLIQAYLIPELADTAHTHRVILLRAFEDPLPELRRQLLQLWENPPPKVTKSDVPLIDLTLAALKYLADKDRRLLIIFDQFEEFFIIPHPSEIVGALRGYFHAILTAPPQGLVILLSYRKDHAHALAPLALPPVTHDLGRNLAINGYSLRPFTIAEAKQFFDERHLRLSDDRLRPALEEASSYEETTAHIRPILLNLLGRIFTILATRNDAWRHTRGLIRAQIRSWALSTELEEDIRPLLGKLISDSGTAIPCSETLLAAALQRTPEQTRPILNDLAAHGILRCPTPDEPSPAKRLWQINHDFIARILQSLIEGLQKTLWKQVRPWIATIGLLLFLIGVFVILPMKSDNERMSKESRILSELSRRGLKYDVNSRAVEHNPSSRMTYENERRLLEQAFAEGFYQMDDFSLLDRFQCRHLDATEWPDLQKSIRGLSRVSTLETLLLSKLSSLEDFSLDDLRHVKKLHVIDDAGLTASVLAPLSKLTLLNELKLRRCNSLEALPDMSDINGLKVLCLEGNTGLKSAASLKTLTHLSLLVSLDLDECTHLEALPELDGMKNLRFVGIRGCTGLKNSDALAPLGKVKTLEWLLLNRCTELAALPDLSGLKKLQHLDLANCSNLSSLPTFRGMSGLTELDLSGCVGLKGFAAFASIANLEALEFLNLKGCTGLSSDDLRALRLKVRPECRIFGPDRVEVKF